MDDFKTLEQQLFEYNGDDRIVLSTELAERFKTFGDDYKQYIYLFSMPTLDSLLGGVQVGELTIISGPTGMGKTLLAQTFTKNFYTNDIKSVWFTYEVPAFQFLRQFGEVLQVFAMPQSLTDNSLEWVEKRIYESYLKYETKIVFIDHLHYLIDMQTRQNMAIEIGFIMRYLKKLAMRYTQAIFLIAHMTKVKEEREPDTEHLRDSGLIGCEADNVFFIWRKKSDPQRAVLKITKHRRNGVMGKKIDLIKVGNYLYEEEKRHEEEDEND